MYSLILEDGRLRSSQSPIPPSLILFAPTIYGGILFVPLSRRVTHPALYDARRFDIGPSVVNHVFPAIVSRQTSLRGAFFRKFVKKRLL
jgi:hypothetical protein